MGEIWLGGPGVALGYLGREELTRERFRTLDGVRYYGTGDLGRWDPSQGIELVGRSDFQVQIRGIRIELAEVEVALRAAPGVRDGAVVAKSTGEDEPLLAAYVAPEPNQRVSTRALLEHLKERLPPAFVPSVVEVLDVLPLNINQKLDRKALMDRPLSEQEASDAGISPRNGLELRVSESFAAGLGRLPHDIDEDFFLGGGHSLSAVNVLRALDERLGVRLPLGALFEAPTVRGLSARMEGSEALKPKAHLLAGAPGAPPFFLVLGLHIYRGLAQRIAAAGYAVYGIYVLQEDSLLDPDVKSPSVRELAEAYAAVIREHPRRGPHRVAGISFGGIIAYEVAQQLLAVGDEVECVGLLDTTLPRTGLRGRLTRMKTWLKARLDRELLRLHRRLSNLGALRSLLSADGGLWAPARRRELAFRTASHRYRARPLPKRVRARLVTAGLRRREENDRRTDGGWRSVVEHLGVQDVPEAAHLAILEEPHVELVSAHLLEGL